MIERHGSIFSEPEGVPSKQYWDSAIKAVIQARKNIRKRKTRNVIHVDGKTWDEIERLIKLEDYAIYCGGSHDRSHTL